MEAQDRAAWERTLNCILYAARTRRAGESQCFAIADLSVCGKDTDTLVAAVEELIQRGLVRAGIESADYELTNSGRIVSDAADSYNGNPHTPLSGPTLFDRRVRRNDVATVLEDLQDGHTL